MPITLTAAPFRCLLARAPVLRRLEYQRHRAMAAPCAALGVREVFARPSREHFALEKASRAVLTMQPSPFSLKQSSARTISSVGVQSCTKLAASFRTQPEALSRVHPPSSMPAGAAAEAVPCSESNMPLNHCRDATELLSCSTPQTTAPAGDAAEGLSPSEPQTSLLRPDVPPEVLSCSEPHRTPLSVAVLLSGGVDSSVALRLLHVAGHQCTAFYLKIWFQEDFRNSWEQCPWEEDLAYAQAVCDQIGVELRVVPLTEEYWSLVVSECMEEIRAGRTPNPDMLCNSRIKFGAFFSHIDLNSFDRVASGHYACIQEAKAALQASSAVADSSDKGDSSQPNSTEMGTLGMNSAGPSSSRIKSKERGELLMTLCNDDFKDQTYFLSHLSQQQLSKVMFPLGCLTKTEVRRLAEVFGLPNSARKDSQGICFLGKVKFGEFVAEHIGEREGRILEAETGEELGRHRGFWFFTVGQRQGIRLPGGPWYVVAKDTHNNVIFVSKKYYSTEKKRRRFWVGQFSWLLPVTAMPGEVGVLVPLVSLGRQPKSESTRQSGVPVLNSGVVESVDWSSLHCKVRHGQNLYKCSVEFLGQNPEAPPLTLLHGYSQISHWRYPSSDQGEGVLRALVTLDEDDQGLAAGQYAVFYAGRVCLGGAKILGMPDDGLMSAVSENALAAAGRTKEEWDHVYESRKSKTKRKREMKLSQVD